MNPPNRRPPRAWATVHQAPTNSAEPSAAEVVIYDAIGSDGWGGGLSAKDLADQISALDVDTLNVYISSPGGDAWDGLAIANALRRHRATVNVTIDALAASAASVIAMAGDHVTMARGAEMMIHDASGLVYGNAQDMRDTADVLDKLCDSYADCYAARAGGTRDQWRQAMRAETWYSAEEAVLAGLADQWDDAPETTATGHDLPHRTFDLAQFRFRGRAGAPAPTIPLPAAGPKTPNPTDEETPMSDNLTDGIRQRLGLPADADDTAILTALDDRLTAAAEAPTIPEGTTLIDEQMLDALRADAAAGREAAAALAASRRDGLVDEAVREGRIAPAARAQWREMAEKDEETARKLLASLAPNTVPVAEVGIGAADETMTADDQLYAAAWGSKEN